uniref:Nucleotidyltransferase domain protein n=1 Tax=uncultured bacterium CSLF42 TaxID=1091574 RepID=G4WVZ9_9BACT|nr:nucleotidyltransferase domain protein [uncultured bacterium CSLF42]
MPSNLRRELNRVIKRLIQRYRPEQIILFGSLASGRPGTWSDIDLAVIKKTRRRFIDRLKDALLAAQPKEALDVLVYTPDEIEQMESARNPFWIHEIKGKGQTLYQRS